MPGLVLYLPCFAPDPVLFRGLAPALGEGSKTWIWALRAAVPSADRPHVGTVGAGSEVVLAFLQLASLLF